jgi:hypothetical protein
MNELRHCAEALALPSQYPNCSTDISVPFTPPHSAQQISPLRSRGYSRARLNMDKTINRLRTIVYVKTSRNQ